MEFLDDSRDRFPSSSNLRRQRLGSGLGLRKDEEFESLIHKLENCNPTFEEVPPPCSLMYESDRINTSIRSNHKETELPYLMLTEDMRKGFLNFMSLHDGSIQSLSLPSVFNGARIVGSSLGWLLMAVHVPVKSLLREILNIEEKVMIENFLFNPFLKKTVKLPSQTTLSHWTSNCYVGIRRFALSSIPTSDNIADGKCIVAIISASGQLAFCKPGDASWTEWSECMVYADIIFHKGKLSAVRYNEQLAIAIVNTLGSGGELTIVDMIPPTDRRPGNSEYFINGVETTLSDIVKHYLVESDDDLLMVLRFSNYEPYNVTTRVPSHIQTDRFKVYKYCDMGPKWEEIESLGDKMIFLGINSSQCYSSTNFSGVLGDSIYFNDDNFEGEMMEDEKLPPFNDLGVYRLSKGYVEPCLRINSTSLNFRSFWH